MCMKNMTLGNATPVVTSQTDGYQGEGEMADDAVQQNADGSFPMTDGVGSNHSEPIPYKPVVNNKAPFRLD